MRRLSLLRIPTQFLTAALVAAGVIGLLAACSPGGSLPLLGDRVWRDVNGNGHQDPGEPGAAGVKVSLYREDGTLVASTETDQEGAYQFEVLREGLYFLEFTAPPGNRFTLANVGDNMVESDDAVDSDADPTTGRTAVFGYTSEDPSRDAGLIEVEPTPTPLPPATATPEPPPVVPPTGGVYRFTVTFVWVSGECGLPNRFVDTLEWDISAADPGATGQTTRVSQPSTGDVNNGQTLPNGEGQASSPLESYEYTLEFVRDETGVVVRVIVTGINTYTYQGCVTVYEIEGEGEPVGE